MPDREDLGQILGKWPFWAKKGHFGTPGPGVQNPGFRAQNPRISARNPGFPGISGGVPRGPQNGHFRGSGAQNLGSGGLPGTLKARIRASGDPEGGQIRGFWGQNPGGAQIPGSGICNPCPVFGGFRGAAALLINVFFGQVLVCFLRAAVWRGNGGFRGKSGVFREFRDSGGFAQDPRNRQMCIFLPASLIFNIIQIILTYFIILFNKLYKHIVHAR